LTFFPLGAPIKNMQRLTFTTFLFAPAWLFLALTLAAQTPVPAAQTPAQPSEEPSQTPVIRSRSQSVLVPALVVDKDNETVAGLHAEDFAIFDNGVEQKAHLDEEPASQPVSLVVMLQTGRSASLNLEARQCHSAPGGAPYGRERKQCTADLSGLTTMLQAFLTNPESRVAVLTFDSHVHPVQDFSPYSDALAGKLEALPDGDGGAAILDAVGRAIHLLAQRPPNDRRILLLISEMRDHGSHATTVEQAVEKISGSDTLIYSLAYSPFHAETMRDLRGEGPQYNAVGSVVALITRAVQGMKQNVAYEMADLTGGEYALFKNRDSFEVSLATLANHVHARYLLSFQPSDAKPGLHQLEVRLKHPQPGEAVQARSSYWATAE
jgi:VWFA-related protein